MKEIVIKMSDEDYEFTKGAKTARFFPSEYYVKLILNGTELPKGHGELVDTRELIQNFSKASSAMKENGIAPVFDLHEITDLILAQDVLVEADKEENRTMSK